MVLQCLTWIPALWTQLVILLSKERRNDDIKDLPDHVVFDILTRLPAESVLKCRRVSKHWLALTSSPYFTRIHLKRASPNFLVQSIEISHSLVVKDCKVNFFIYEDFHQLKGKFKKMSKRQVVVEDYQSIMVGCCDGLVVFLSGDLRYHVRNIVSLEKVIIQTPEPLIFMGIFFHPVAKEYKLLFHGHKSPKTHQYHVFIYSSCTKVWSEVTTFSSRRKYSPNPVFINDVLYWMSDCESGNEIPCCRKSIIMFETDTENFQYMHHPGGQCQTVGEHKSFVLLEMDGLLCCCSLQRRQCQECIPPNGLRCCCSPTTTVSIWVLEDRSWVLRYKVDLGFIEKKFPSYGRSSYRILLWKIENGELIFYWYYRGLFRCHLQHNTVQRIDFPKLSGDHKCIALSCPKSVVSFLMAS